MIRSRELNIASIARRAVLACASILMLCAGAASATTTGSATSFGAPPALEILCQGDCSGLLAVEPPRAGAAFDFELGVRADGGGFDLSLVSDGNIFLVGPLRASGAIRLFAPTTVEFRDAVVVEANEIHIDTGVSVIPLPPILPPRIEYPNYDPICGCITVAEIVRINESEIDLSGAGGDLVLEGDRIRLAAASALMSVVQTQTVSGLAISRSGDLYVDLSRVRLANLKVEAGGAIVVAGLDSLPVPEPGPALLLGLGLGALASHRKGNDIG